MLGENVELNAYHLYLLGVHPNFQRKGIATALQQAVEAVVSVTVEDFQRVLDNPILFLKATERGKDLVVETTGVRNVSASRILMIAQMILRETLRQIAVYERLGFTLKGSGKYDRANGEEGEIFILLKQPRSVLSP